MDALPSRITIDPALCHGKPCIRGLRYPVEMLLDLLNGGMTFDEVLADYKDLERDDLLAALAFATRQGWTLHSSAGRAVRGEEMATTLKEIAARGGLTGFSIAPEEWQRDVRKDRPLPGRSE